MPPPIKIFFLGTGGTAPFNLRKMPCIALKYEGYLIIFDLGEFCQFSLIEKRLHPFRSKTYILISHLHADHVGGLPTFLHTFNLTQTAKPIHIVGPSGTKIFLETIINTFGIDPVKNKLRILEVTPENHCCVAAVRERSFTIYAFKTEHSIPSLGYVFQERDFRKFDDEKAKQYGIPRTRIRKLLLRGKSVEVLGKIIHPDNVTTIIPGRRIVYTGDTRPLQYLAEIAKNADLLIHEATFLKEHKSSADAKDHSTIEEVIEIAGKANVKTLALVHISPRYAKKLDAIAEYTRELSVQFGIKLIIPNDGDEITI
ncbi:MAG: ribonuclease Z [Crenarchaeota archaeon]|nr:ribonuclease Z [Thermoproteota archaeon]MCR8453873.1 ribonuclease Z [Thermoproteota archaeon]MCR8455308.1 ribonuclease Z [Thermoproteota archaeon]MCR8462578.1 ribonuclease Z [Thermoproteota archaeon]MCR8471716.1 ribonuclease Z [Thermoproteota archaeon]